MHHLPSSNSLHHRRAIAIVLAVLLATPLAARLSAQAPAQAPTPAPTTIPPAPAAPTPEAPAGPEFPKPDPADFNATSPTKAQVEEFLQASWGYDTSRVYQIQRISKTVVPGITTVVVLVGEKGNKQTGALQFFVLADGQHIITAGEILPFGAHPYAENRSVLIQRADGPSKGPASKDLELVEFADFQCPHCKEAQPNMDKLATDFPTAHIVYETFPLTHIHPQAFRSAAYGVCVAKLGGTDAFFKYSNAVYEGQAGLATEEGATLTLNDAVNKAGQDPAKIEACSKTPETEAAVKAQIKLAEDLNINQTPSLAINGRIIPIGGINYDTLKKMISYHMANDGPAK